MTKRCTCSKCDQYGLVPQAAKSPQSPFRLYNSPQADRSVPIAAGADLDDGHIGIA